MSLLNVNKTKRSVNKIKRKIVKFVYVKDTTDAEAISYLELIQELVQRLLWEVKRIEQEKEKL